MSSTSSALALARLFPPWALPTAGLTYAELMPAVKQDLSKYEGVEALVAEFKKHEKHLNVLVNKFVDSFISRLCSKLTTNLTALATTGALPSRSTLTPRGIVCLVST